MSEVDWEVWNTDFFFFIWGKEFNENNSGGGKRHADLEEQGIGHLAEHVAF